MSDPIDRQAAINAVISLCDDCDSGYCGSCRVNYPGEKDARKALEALPSAQPDWIPCSERLPEDSQFVLMTIRRMDKHYNHKPFISVGYITWNQSLWWCAHDGDCEPNNIRVDAWMPLPKVYEEGDKK